MNFNEQLRSEIDKIDVPEELLPENIAVMLKAKTAQNGSRIRQTKAVGRSSSAVFRTLAAAAACLALAAGFIIYSDKVNKPASLDSEIEYKDVSSRPGSYGDLYNIYTQICLNGENTAPEYEAEDDLSATDLADGLTETDILKSENGTIYYIDNKGGLCTLSENGDFLSINLGINSPIDMYIDNDRLVIISGSSASESLSVSDVPAEDAIAAGSGTSGLTGESSEVTEMRNSVTADIFDISEGVRHLESFTQSGEYVSSRIFGGNLSIVTDYSDYHTKPLSEETDLDNYVPYYELNGKRIYVAAEDIYVTADASSTEYTVASSYNISGGAVSVKAVLGSTGKVYCPGDTLYIVNPGQRENDKPYTAISAFSLGSTIEYISGGSVEGTVIGRSLDEKDGFLRAAARNTLADGSSCTDVYVLDRDLSVVNSAGQLLPGEKLQKAAFSGDYVSLYTDRKSSPSMVLKLSENPPKIAQDMMNSLSSYYIGYNDRLVLGAGKAEWENGECFELSMFDAGSGARYDSVKFAAGYGITSPAETNRRALLIDSEQGIIGIPVSYDDEFGTHSLYYLYRYTDDNGFNEVGKVEYTDPSENSGFRRAVVSGGTIYIISDTRIVAARTEDMKVIQVFETN